MKKTEKKTTESYKKSRFLATQNYMKQFDGYHGNVKNERQTIDKLKFSQRNNEHPLEVLAL